jgi:tetratricopeptide (TPR) repeat protein
MALSGLGNLAEYRTEYERAEELYTKSLELSREADDRRGIASAMGNLGVVAQRRGDLSAARTAFEAAREHFGALGLQAQVGASLNNLSVISILEGDLGAARGLALESLEVREKLGDTSGVAGCHTNLATIELRGEALPQAARHASKALRLNLELGAMYHVTGVLDVCGDLLSAVGQPEVSARLYARAERIRQEIGTPLPEDDEREREPDRRRVAEALGPERLEAEKKLGEVGELEPFVEGLLERLEALQ